MTVRPQTAIAESDRLNYAHCRTMAINYVQIIYIQCHSSRIVALFPSFTAVIKFCSWSWDLFCHIKLGLLTACIRQISGWCDIGVEMRALTLLREHFAGVLLMDGRLSQT